MIKFYDTSSLLRLGEKAFEEPFATSSVVLNELENIKTSRNKTEDIRFTARRLVRLFDTNSNYEVIVQTVEHEKIILEHNLPITNDNLIVAMASEYYKYRPNSVFVTNDLILRLVAINIFKIPADKIVDTPLERYKGYKEFYLSDNEMERYYGNLNSNSLNLLQNQYALIYNKDGEIVDRRKWNGSTNEVIQYNQISNDYIGTVKPKNLQQELAFDMLQDEDTPIKVLAGLQGSGKDHLMISHALDFIIRKHKYDKILWVRNNVEVKDTRQVGFLPGTLDDKLMPFAQIMADHVGGQSGLDRLINEGQIELQHLGLIRGRDIKNSIIMCSEAENLTKEHIQLLIGRVGEGSTLWINGDTKQTDGAVFESNNGLDTMTDKLKCHKNFGIVRLEKCERSEVAAMADLLD